MPLRLYLRRSRADEGHQQFSLDTQRTGCHAFAASVGATGPAVEYVDDDRAGDDFVGRAGLQRLLRDAQGGDVIICRDQSRLGRDALEVTLAIRTLVRDRGARLFYYSTRQEVPFAGAIDAAVAFIGGIGGQLEVEAIRSRTREALRARVAAGHVAGGACYGYRLERRRDAAGRAFTVAEIDEAQAAVVRRIFTDYAAGSGLKSLAKALNAERVPSPRAGRRGTGSWGPGTIQSMLRNERYAGVYIHGRAIRKRQGGHKVLVRRAGPDELVRVEMPGWRIVDEVTWARVRTVLAGARSSRRQGGPVPRHALSGVARCGWCGGPICVLHKRIGQATVKAYGCSYHQSRGPEVCPVTVRQPIEEVERSLAAMITERLAAQQEGLQQAIRAELARRQPPPADTAALEAELRSLRQEQRRLVRVAAAVDGQVSELAAELADRATRIAEVEKALAAAAAPPVTVDDLAAEVEQLLAGEMAELREALGSDPDRYRAALKALFPTGLILRPHRAGHRHAWLVDGIATVTVVSPAGHGPLLALAFPVAGPLLLAA